MSRGLLKSAICAIGLVVFLGLLMLLVEFVENEGQKVTPVKSSSSVTRGSFMEPDDVVGRRRLAAFHDHDVVNLNYMSKRKVPNGPDPIHNRKAGNSRRPPGRG